MKTTGVRSIPKFALLVFLGHPNAYAVLTPQLVINIRDLSSTCVFYSIIIVARSLVPPKCVKSPTMVAVVVDFEDQACCHNASKDNMSH